MLQLIIAISLEATFASTWSRFVVRSTVLVLPCFVAILLWLHVLDRLLASSLVTTILRLVPPLVPSVEALIGSRIRSDKSCWVSSAYESLALDLPKSIVDMPKISFMSKRLSDHWLNGRTPHFRSIIGRTSAPVSDYPNMSFLVYDDISIEL